MRISAKGLAAASALLWGGAVGAASVAHLAEPEYGKGFLDAVSSIYPGFHGARDARDAAVGTAYALADGALGGLIFAWLYNACADNTRERLVAKGAGTGGAL